MSELVAKALVHVCAFQQHPVAADFGRYAGVLIQEGRKEEGALHRDVKFQRTLQGRRD